MHYAKFKFILGLCLTLLTPLSAHSFEDAYISLGNLTQYVGRYQQSENPDLNGFDLNPYLSGGLQYNISESFSLIPEVGFVIKSKKQDDLINVFTYFLHLNLGYRYNDFLFRLGTGLINTKISSDESTQTLPNGTGTSDFPMPQTSSTSTMMVANAGIEYFMFSQLSLRSDLHLYNLADSDTMTYGYSIAATFHFSELLKPKKKKPKRRLRPKKVKKQKTKKI